MRDRHRSSYGIGMASAASRTTAQPHGSRARDLQDAAGREQARRGQRRDRRAREVVADDSADHPAETERRDHGQKQHGQAGHTEHRRRRHREVRAADADEQQPRGEDREKAGGVAAVTGDACVRSAR